MGKGHKHLNQLPQLSQVHHQETGLEVEKPGQELVPVWDTGIADGSSAYYAPTQAPVPGSLCAS